MELEKFLLSNQSYNFSSNCFFLIKYVFLDISPLAYSFLYFFNFISTNRLTDKTSSRLCLFCLFGYRLGLMVLGRLKLPFFFDSVRSADIFYFLAVWKQRHRNKGLFLKFTHPFLISFFSLFRTKYLFNFRLN